MKSRENETEQGKNKNSKRKPKKKHRKLVLASVLILMVLIYIGISFLLSANKIAIKEYSYDSDKIDQPVTIISLADLHSHSFGKNNKRLVREVEKQEPDLICIVGDAVNYYDEEDTYITSLIRQLMRIAPVYFSLGNHEISMFNNHRYINLKQDIEQTGALYLDQTYLDITVKNQKIRIGGFYDYAFNYAGVSPEQYRQKSSYLFLKDYEETDLFKLMLTHRPESFLDQEPNSRWKIDLVLSGHEHGGQLRLPFIGALYSSHLGGVWFPGFTEGYQVMNGIPVVISRGLGTYKGKNVPPRFNNIPEITKIVLK